MKKKMSNRDKKILYIFGTILIIAASYFLVYSKMETTRKALVDENITLKTEVDRLNRMEAKKDVVSDNTNAIVARIDEKLQVFPLEVRTQNAISDLYDMCQSIEGVKIQSESYQMNQIFYQSGDGTAEEGLPQIATGVSIESGVPISQTSKAASGYVGYRSDVAVAFTANYANLQKVIKFIKESENRKDLEKDDAGDRMTITELSATKDTESEELVCNMTVSMYAISGTSDEYLQPDVNEIDTISDTNNKSGIFGK